MEVLKEISIKEIEVGDEVQNFYNKQWGKVTKKSRRGIFIEMDDIQGWLEYDDEVIGVRKGK